MGYIPHTDEDRQAMLGVIGVQSIDELFKDIPAHLQLQGDLGVPPRLDEQAIKSALSALANKNCSTDHYDSFLGAGVYDHFSPSLLYPLLSRGEFLSAYTPYQPELSQGNLQTIYEFQSMVCELTGMDVSNASMYDAGTSAAEAALLAIQATNRTEIVVSEAVHPHYVDCIRTYAWASSFEVKTIPAPQGVTDMEQLQTLVNENTACVLIQSPNFFGCLEDQKRLIGAAQQAGALAIVCADPIALGLLKPPGEYGADIVVAEGQSLGWSMGFGGPMLGLFACKNDFVRRIPGRIVGQTVDAQGRRGFVMTLRTREQDIRRERATSNICTNEALIALAATIFMVSVGKHGFKQMAEASLQKAHYAANQLSAIPGVSLRFDQRFFKEFTLQLPKPASEVRDALLRENIIAGLPLGDYYPEHQNSLLVAVTDLRTKAQIDRFAGALAQSLGV